MKEKLQKYFIYFVLYSMIGWIYEVFLEVVVYKWGFNNRGVLFGPYCPVYGFGALAFIFTVYPLVKDKKWTKKILMIPIVFLLCMGIATLIELVTSYICEFAMGSWPWQTYRDYKYNFQGRIALSPSLRFGLGGVIFLYLLQPLFEKICNKLSSKKLIVITSILGIALVCDMIYTFFISNNFEKALIGSNKIVKMRAVIVNVYDDEVLVTEIGTDRMFLVRTAKENDLKFQNGQEILIYYDGIIETTDPEQISAPEKIEIIKASDY